VTGGENFAVPFSDNTAVLSAELWDPVSEQFTTMASMAVPRTYHSVALLLPDGRVRYLNAGHPPLLWLKADGGIEHLGATGPLLNRIFRDRPLPVGEVALSPGDRLLAYTDGTFEARNPADQELGSERLEQAFVDLRDRPPGEAVDALMDLVMAYCEGRPVTDDVTVVMVEREG